MELALGIARQAMSNLFLALKTWSQKRENKMKASWKKACVTVMVMILAAVSSGLVGCSKKGSAAYTVNHRIIAQSIHYAGMKVVVSGPADNLVVALTNPSGTLEARQLINKDEMAPGCCAVDLSVIDPSPGKWILEVKKLGNEKLVWRKEFMLSLDQLKVEDIELGLQPVKGLSGQVTGYKLKSLGITLHKVGDLPVEFTYALASLNGEKYETLLRVTSGQLMADNHHKVNTDASFPPTEEMADRDIKRGEFFPSRTAIFEPGSKVVVKGKLFYFPDFKSLDFTKEFVVPGKGSTIIDL